MPDYSKTIIYKLCCNDTSIEDIYVGSTCNFSKRKNSHKSDCNNENNKNYNYKVYKFIRDNGNFENWSMYQIEAKPVENKREKETLERQWIEKLKPTLNSYIPTRTKEEYYQDNKEQILDRVKNYYQNNKEQIVENKEKYYQDNKERLDKINKEYRKTHKEEKQKQDKERYETHKDKIKEHAKKYREENKEKIKERSSKKFTCECGSEYTTHHKLRHFKTKKHQTFINQ